MTRPATFARAAGAATLHTGLGLFATLLCSAAGAWQWKVAMFVDDQAASSMPSFYKGTIL